MFQHVLLSVMVLILSHACEASLVSPALEIGPDSFRWSRPEERHINLHGQAAVSISERGIAVQKEKAERNRLQREDLLARSGNSVMRREAAREQFQERSHSRGRTASDPPDHYSYSHGDHQCTEVKESLSNAPNVTFFFEVKSASSGEKQMLFSAADNSVEIYVDPEDFLVVCIRHNTPEPCHKFSGLHQSDNSHHFEVSYSVPCKLLSLYKHGPAADELSKDEYSFNHAVPLTLHDGNFIGCNTQTDSASHGHREPFQGEIESFSVEAATYENQDECSGASPSDGFQPPPPASHTTAAHAANATHATSATTATHANHATHATHGNHSTHATHKTHATHATHSTHATHVSHATHATSTTTSTTTTTTTTHTTTTTDTSHAAHAATHSGSTSASGDTPSPANEGDTPSPANEGDTPSPANEGDTPSPASGGISVFTAPAPAPAQESTLTIQNWVNGWCSPWNWGSHLEYTTNKSCDTDDACKAAKDEREGTCYFPGDWEVGATFTQEECQKKCEMQLACEQAVFRGDTSECYLGVNTMNSSHGEGRAVGTGFAPKDDSLPNDHCFAKRGFSYVSHHAGRLMNGFCGSNYWTEGWKSPHSSGGPNPTTCSFSAMSFVPSYVEECSHWPAEFKLSKEGCWAKCDKNVDCTQAVWTKTEDGDESSADHKTYKYNCRIGVFTDMTESLLATCVADGYQYKLFTTSEEEVMYIKTLST